MVQTRFERTRAYIDTYHSSYGQEGPVQRVKAEYAAMQPHWASVEDTLELFLSRVSRSRIRLETTLLSGTYTLPTRFADGGIFKLGIAALIHYFQCLTCGKLRENFLLTQRLLLRRAGAMFDNSVSWTCSTFSTFSTVMQNVSLGTRVFYLIGSLPSAYAAAIGGHSTNEDLRNPQAWIDFTTICHIMGWISTTTFGALVVYLGLRGPKRDFAHYCMLSFGAAGASLVLLDARAAPEIRWPTLAVGFVFLVRFWMRASELYEMGHGWLGPILGLGILTDASFVHLIVNTQSGDQGVFSQLLLTCLCLALSLCAAMARFHQHVRVNRRVDEMV